MTVVPPMLRTELHVFHYASHSVISAVATAEDGQRCAFPSVSHEHTRAGGCLWRLRMLFNSRAEAESYVEKISQEQAERNLSAFLTTYRHNTIPTGQRYAVKIDAGHDSNGNPQRGWIIYDHTGAQTGFIDEGFEHQAALAEAGHVVEFGPITTDRMFYENVSCPI
ncbi:hypothetical protein [Actinoplanes sp. NPDC051411]|uniref:hypothetical protein n=1 Tax=Actinoplanes sp. NPDC051411 TaxID=3155522 RepID=UPI003422D134